MKCIACKLDIEPGAWECVHCETIQNWRRYLTLSNSVLALLVALLSVSTVLVPLVYNTFLSRIADMRFEIPAESNRIGGHTQGSGKSRKTKNASYITRLTVLTMNAGDNVGLLKNLCMKGTIKFDKISEETSHCAYVREDHRVYTKGEHRVFKWGFTHTHRRLPKTVEAGKEGKFKVGPVEFIGKLIIAFDNDVGNTKEKVIPVKIQGFTFTRS